MWLGPDQRCWRCLRTHTIAISSISNGATCTHCLPLFTCTPTYSLTHAYAVYPGPCNGNPRPTSSTSVSSSRSIYIYIYLFLFYFFVTAAYVSWCSPLSWLRNHSKLGVSGLCFVNARFPYLFCVTFLCVLRSCSVAVHICMRVIHILPSPPSSSSFLLLLLSTSQLVDVT